MMLRAIKAFLVFGVAILYTLIVFNNTTDYGSNYEFVRHVMMMDTTFPGNNGMWRAIHSPLLHTLFYVSIIIWEAATMILCWWGGLRMLVARGGTPAVFQRAKGLALAALALGLLQWLVVFLAVGGEWFLMWQSRTWNGQEAGFRMFLVLGIVMLLVAQPDAEGQP
jgi:predicted small integral membrane protein